MTFIFRYPYLWRGIRVVEIVAVEFPHTRDISRGEIWIAEVAYLSLTSDSHVKSVSFFTDATIAADRFGASLLAVEFGYGEARDGVDVATASGDKSTKTCFNRESESCSKPLKYK